VVERKSTKKWIKSYCEECDKYVTLQQINTKPMDISTLIKALKDAEKRGIQDISVIVNSTIDGFCQVPVSEISVSEVTRCIFYIDGCHKGHLGYLRNKNAKNSTN